MNLRCVFVLCFSLAACTAPGIRDGVSISEEVQASMTYEAAYRLADEYARTCHVDPIGIIQRAFPIAGNVFPDNKTAVVRVQSAVNTANDMQRFDIRETKPGMSAIRITVANQSIFKQEELDFAVRAMTTGQIICRRSE